MVLEEFFAVVITLSLKEGEGMATCKTSRS